MVPSRFILLWRKKDCGSAVYEATVTELLGFVSLRDRREVQHLKSSV
jgi:hypothetical protein